MLNQKTVWAVCLSLLLAAVVPRAVYAGLYTDDLSRCLVDSTSTGDRENLVRWMFVAMSAHPAVQTLYSVSAEQVDQSNREIGQLAMKLLTESCVEETSKALKYEGDAGLSGAFEVLGKVAAQEIFSNPSVAQAMAGLQQYFNAEKLHAVLGN